MCRLNRKIRHIIAYLSINLLERSDSLSQDIKLLQYAKLPHCAYKENNILYIVYALRISILTTNVYVSFVLQWISDIYQCVLYACVFTHFNCRCAINSKLIHKKFDIFDIDRKRRRKKQTHWNPLSSLKSVYNTHIIYVNSNVHSIQLNRNLLLSTRIYISLGINNTQ